MGSLVLFVAVSAGLWGLGHYMTAPKSARWMMIGLLYLAILAGQVVFPDTHPLGGHLGEWLVLGLLAALVWAYSKGLERLRRRVRPENRPAGAPDPDRLGPAEITRYARHITLREIGGPGQTGLKKARVLVIGAGGLGSAALQYLGAAGAGTIGVIDDDAVEATNLQRQVIHTDARIGTPKVFSAKAALEAQNPFVTVRTYNRRFTEDIAADLVAEYDLVLDGSDNFDTRYLANRAAIAAGRPLIAAALAQWEGQIGTFAPGDGAPCYACVFPEPPAPGLAPDCAEAGVLGPLPGVVGAMMAVEAIKEITGAGLGLRGRLLIYDALWGETRTIATRRDPACPVCGEGAARPAHHVTGSD